VADVVEQSGDLDVQAHGILELELIHHARSDMVGTEGVPKSGVLGTGVHLPGKAHLLDSPQPLEGAGIEDLRERAVLSNEFHQPVHRIPENAIV
jgi:hypothetical protein